MRPLAGAAFLLIVSSAGWPARAGAHAALVNSAPSARATLSAAPTKVTLTFNERLEAAYARISVWDAAGQQVDLKDGALDGDTRKILAVSLPPLAPGSYTVHYRVLSVDGHVVEASFAFTVRPPARKP